MEKRRTSDHHLNGWAEEPSPFADPDVRPRVLRLLPFAFCVWLIVVYLLF